MLLITISKVGWRLIKSYTELQKLKTFEERYEYLKMGGIVGADTFGFDRYVNQAFYNSPEWKKARDIVIIRDNGCDLGVEGYEIPEHIIIHHMNPINMEQIINRDPIIFDPEFLISVSNRTHNAIHYGDENQIPKGPIERKPGDTKLW